MKLVWADGVPLAGQDFVQTGLDAADAVGEQIVLLADLVHAVCVQR